MNLEVIRQKVGCHRSKEVEIFRNRRILKVGFTLEIRGPNLLTFQMKEFKLSGKSKTVTNRGWGWGGPGLKNLQFMAACGPQRMPSTMRFRR